MNKPTLTRTILGIIVIIIGILALLGAAGLFNFGDIVSRWWPLTLVIGGALLFISNPGRQRLWPAVMVGAGIFLQLRELDLVHFNVWQLLWPVVIIGVGVSVLLNKTGQRLKPSTDNNTTVSVLFSGSDIKNHSEDYKGGSLSSTMGGIELDLRDATIKKTATLNVFVLMGGIELTVPKGWKVQSNVTPILGGVDARALATPEPGAPTLIITGDVLLGGINIKN